MALAQQTYRPVQTPKALEPKTPVDLVFRGGPAIVDKWDGEDIIIPGDAKANAAARVPYWQSLHYEAVVIKDVPWDTAQHLRSRAIVPGTRDPFHSKKAVYQVAILKTPNGQSEDKPELCEPLTDAELEKFETAAEGIDRSVFLDSRKKATTLDTMGSISHVGNVSEILEAPPTDEDLAPAADHEGLGEIRRAEIAAEGEGQQVSRTRRGRPARFRDDR